MKTIRCSILCLAAFLFSASVLSAQDFSTYRGVSLGTSLATVLKLTDQKLADVNMTYGSPSTFQEVTWWPPSLRGTAYRSDSVEQILFSFYNGTLYKMSVTYGQSSTEGLTAQDMGNSISAKYGAATSIAPVVDPASNVGYDGQGKLVASWEDSLYSINLVRSSFTGHFGLVIYSKQANAEAELAVVDALKLAKQDGPKREAERQRKQTSDLEVARQKNQKSFRP
jgi:hypothetical protein